MEKNVNDDKVFESIVRIILSKSCSSQDEDEQEYAFLVRVLCFFFSLSISYVDVTRSKTQLAEYVLELISNGKSSSTISKSIGAMGESKEIVERVIACIEKREDQTNDSNDDTRSNDENQRIQAARSKLNQLLDKKYPELKDRSWGLKLENAELGSRICILLDEPKEEKMIRAVDRVGKLFVVNVLRETLSIEQIGGLSIASGQRRRTSGGVFWTLLESQITKDDKKYITKLERQARNRRRNAGRQEHNNKSKMKHSSNRRHQYKQTIHKHYGTEHRRESTRSRQQERRHQNQMHRRRRQNHY